MTRNTSRPIFGLVGLAMVVGSVGYAFASQPAPVDEPVVAMAAPAVRPTELRSGPIGPLGAEQTRSSYLVRAGLGLETQ